MSGNLWRTIRTIIRYAFYAGCVIIVVLPIVLCASFLMNPFAGFAGQSEFTDLSGRAAKRRLSQWPHGIDSGNVQNVSYKCNYARDSSSSWYRIQMTSNAAITWMNHIHKYQEDGSRRCLHHLHQELEGVHRTVPGPPPLHWQTGDTPTWWTPPSIDFRATEVMLWYTNYDSGVGRATYSTFDKSTGILWVYDYAAQHDTLWSRGSVPTGNVFSTMAK
jgi:hypothetical protein